MESASAAELVHGDVVKLSLGSIVPADARLIDGSVLVEAEAGFEIYAGALIRRGETVAAIVATGAHTNFGRTAELIRTAHIESTEQKAICPHTPAPAALRTAGYLRQPSPP